MKHITYKTLLTLALSLAFGSSAFAATVPTVVTTNASGITKTAATLNINLTNDGGATVTTLGVQYGPTTTYGPTQSMNASFTVPYAKSFTVNGLTCGTTYHYRAFAANSAGTSYGIDKGFATNGCNTATTVTGTPFTGSISGNISSSVVPPTSTVLPTSQINPNILNGLTVLNNSSSTSIPIINAVPTTISVTPPVINPNISITTPVVAPTIPNAVPTTISVQTVNPGIFTLPDPAVVTPVPSTSTQVNGGGGGGGGVISYNYVAAGGETSTFVPTVTVAPLRPKTKSPNVSVLQWVLKVKGSYTGPVDGSYGPKTKAAVKSYQKSTAVLTADGFAGRKTLAHLGILIKSK